jgi:hypothetical protein
LIVIRAGSTGPHASVNEARTPRILRGFSPHRVADDDIITGCCERMAQRGGLPRLPTTPRVGDILVGSRRADPHPLHRVDRAATAPYPLLLLRPGRHALDETGASRTTRASTTWLVGEIAVKNLRIAASAVLLLNFDEVRDLRLCSMGVAV